ncbi:MAG: hypothetical protein GY708_00100 [Actinomycetia bacterium]|nr:hypothetical protein [Actinomycetes bacterium]MCP5035180.1 hypothetical protein [Actinomycetes bacterium]
MNNNDDTGITRTFVVITIAGALVAWDIGFEYGAFDTISYRRVLTVFVVSTVVLIATIVKDDDTFATSILSRIVLGLPLAYLIADLTFLTTSQTVVDILGIAIIASFPYTLYVIARLLDQDYFTLPHRERLIAAIVVAALGLAGFYVGTANDRFLTCTDFERTGDYQPANCQP